MHRLIPMLVASLIVTYPIITHISINQARPLVPLLWLAILVILALFYRIKHTPRIDIGVSLIASLLFAINLNNFPPQLDWFIRFPPIIMQFGLAWVFGRTLRPGRTPLIVQIGLQVRGYLPPAVVCYGRNLTVIWTGLFIALGIECSLLAIFASPYWWSLFTNLINYVLIVALLLLEYPIRRRILGDLEPASLLESLRAIVQINWRSVLFNRRAD